MHRILFDFIVKSKAVQVRRRAHCLLHVHAHCETFPQCCSETFWGTDIGRLAAGMVVKRCFLLVARAQVRASTAKGSRCGLASDTNIAARDDMARMPTELIKRARIVDFIVGEADL